MNQITRLAQRVFIVVIFVIPSVMRVLLASICRKVPSDCAVVEEMCTNINFLGLTSIEFPFVFTCKDATRYLQQLKQFDILGVWFEVTLCATVGLTFIILLVEVLPPLTVAGEVQRAQQQATAQRERLGNPSSPSVGRLPTSATRSNLLSNQDNRRNLNASNLFDHFDNITSLLESAQKISGGDMQGLSTVNSTIQKLRRANSRTSMSPLSEVSSMEREATKRNNHRSAKQIKASTKANRGGRYK